MIKQTRVLLSILLFTLTLLVSLTIVPRVDSVLLKVVIPILFMTTISFLLYLFTIGHLTVIVTGDRLEFFWRKRKLLPYNNIDPIEISEIRTLVIDQGQVLQKIVTVDRVVTLGTGKTKDGQKFINFLSSTKNLKTMDSWDIWKERGLLGIAYWTNLVILVVISSLATYFIITKGFSSHILLFVLGGLIQLYLYHGVIKSKLKN